MPPTFNTMSSIIVLGFILAGNQALKINKINHPDAGLKSHVEPPLPTRSTEEISKIFKYARPDTYFDEIQKESWKDFEASYSSKLNADEPANVYHNLRIPKCGSTAMVYAFKACHEHVEDDFIKFHFHTTFLEDLSAEKQQRTFTVMREPADRFVSQWNHMVSVMPLECGKYLNGTGIQSKYDEFLKSPITWAQALIKDQDMNQKFLHRTQSDSKKFPFFEQCKTSMVMWPQSNYVSKGGHQDVGCLGKTAYSTASQVLKKAGSSCEIKEQDANHKCNDCNMGVDMDELIPLVKELYPEDSQLWDMYCS